MDKTQLTPLLLCVAVLVGCPSSPRPMGKEIPKHQLKLKARLPLPTPLAPPFATTPPRCDGEGNLYFRYDNKSSALLMSGPYVRVSADAQRFVVIGLESVPDFPHDNSHIEAFVVGPQGEMHLLAWKDDGHFLLAFDSDGRFQSASKVDLRLFVSGLAVFPTGEILATGEKLTRKAGDSAGVALNVVFDRHGKVVGELDLPGDVQPDPNKPANQRGVPISLGHVVTGDDRNIYLMRATQNPLIFVISPARKVLRKLTLVPPSQDLHGGNFSVVNGKILMMFSKLTGSIQDIGSFVYCLYDAETGERQIDFEQGPNSFGMFACYTPDRFTFLGFDGNRLSIIHAVPQ